MTEGTKNPLGPAGHNVRRNVRRLREERRMSYRELSERLVVAGRLIPVLGLSRMERGERRVDADDLVALAVVFGISPGQLLEPPADCPNCHGTPPPGFICIQCDTTSLLGRSASGEQPGPRSST